MLLLEDLRNYIYAYLDPRKPGEYTYGKYTFEYCPFYIGKGKGRRIYEHLEPRYLNKHTFKNNMIKKIIRLGHKPITIKIFENLSNKEACKYEIDLISKIGRRDKKLGPLANKTDGGEGSIGFCKETIDKLSKMRRGHKNPMFHVYPSEKTRRLLSIRQSGKNNGMYGRKHSLKSKIEMSKHSAMAKSITINNIFYKSIRDASRKLNVKHYSIEYRLKNKNFPNYKYASAA